MHRCLLVLALVCLPTASALADERFPLKSPPSSSFDFEDDLVMGETYSPDTEQLVVRKRGARASLIEVRSSYVPELLRSVEDM